MRISKQSAPYVDSYDLTVSRDELKIIHDALFMLEHHPDTDRKMTRTFHSVNLNDRKEQLYEDMTTHEKVKQIRSTMTDIKGLVD